MKTPKEIKMGLKCCGCLEYTYTCGDCPYYKNKRCEGGLEGDAIEYMEHLENRLAEEGLERHLAVVCIAKIAKELMESKFDTALCYALDFLCGKESR